ncbi:protein kinase family protein [Nocardioides alcanivorans]|uniref:protein kinase family protein n=1 Tax=Nocardioides alcanivorans TaxID=2897352 RepID=UPI001F2BE421|nr:protein kinase family protein [Nocardioides alcanivorans]
MPGSTRPGDVLANRYRLIDLLSEARFGRFWRAWDSVLSRPVAIHLIAADDSRAADLREAARCSAQLHDPHLLRVLDTGTVGDWCYVVNEWGEGDSLDILLADEPLSPRRAAWIAGEVAELLANAQRQGLTHGRLVPDNVLIDQRGSVKVIGFAVDAALHGGGAVTPEEEFHDLIGVLYAGLTGRWPRPGLSKVAAAPRRHGSVLRPRQVRAGVPRVLDTMCDAVLNHAHHAGHHRPGTAAQVSVELYDFVGDRQAMAEAEVERNRGNTSPRIPAVNALVWAPPPPQPEPEPDTGDETEVGLPGFDDEILDPEWRTPSPEPPPPPPPSRTHPSDHSSPPSPRTGSRCGCRATTSWCRSRSSSGHGRPIPVRSRWWRSPNRRNRWQGGAGSAARCCSPSLSSSCWRRSMPSTVGVTTHGTTRRPTRRRRRPPTATTHSSK